MHLRALALISGAAALSTPRGVAKGLAVRGGGLDVEQIASGAVRKSTFVKKMLPLDAIDASIARRPPGSA